MQYICLNLKRFDVPSEMGGVSGESDARAWAANIVRRTQDALRAYEDARFPMYFPEAHLISALDARTENSPVIVGCQGVYRQDVAPGESFGALTGSRPAAAMAALGVESALIGHCEERRDLCQTGADTRRVSAILADEIACALSRNLSVLYCVGETAQEVNSWQETLRGQLDSLPRGVDGTRVVIAYEPVWSIGPGKTPASREHIQKIARFIRDICGLPVIYGGGLKAENARMLASIPEIDGGLIALTRFTGRIGFYADEYLEIIHQFMEGKHEAEL